MTKIRKILASSIFVDLMFIATVALLTMVFIHTVKDISTSQLDSISAISVDNFKDGFIEGYEFGYTQGISDAVKVLSEIRPAVPQDYEDIIPIDPNGPKIYPDIPDLENDGRIRE